MKTVYILAASLLILLSLQSCDKTETVTQPTLFEKNTLDQSNRIQLSGDRDRLFLDKDDLQLREGEYTGSFSVTFKNYKNIQQLIQTGKVLMKFKAGEYNYTANVEYSSDESAFKTLEDRGTYSCTADKIYLLDIANLRMDPLWHNSLYLFDSFKIERKVNSIKLSNENLFASWVLELSRAK